MARRGEPGRIKWKLSELFRAAGIEASPYDFWQQEGAYRSVKWDLARWGVRNGRWIDATGKYPGPLHIYSWDTMTDCVRYGINLQLAGDGEHRMSPWEVEVSRKEKTREC